MPSESKDMALHKLPPQNLEAEEAVLSAVLIEDDALLAVADILEPEDFYRDAHKKIYSAVLELFNKREPADVITLANVLKERGELEAVGGSAYIGRLVDSVPMAANASHHARIIRQKAILRRLISKATEIATKAYEDKGDAEELVDFAEAAIFSIAEKKSGVGFAPLKDLIYENLNTIEKQNSEKALVTGVQSGFKKLDSLTSGFQPSDLIILAARPGMGKTAFALNIAKNAATLGNHAVAVFSLEMTKEQLAMRLLCSDAGVDSKNIRDAFLSGDDFKKLVKAGDRLSVAPIFIDDSSSLTSLDVRARSRRQKMETGLGLIIIDYLQLMKGPPGTERRDLEISEISRSLKALAKELKLPVIALSQLNRKVEDRGGRPQLSDLRESGAIEQDADVIMFLYREEAENPEDVVQLKIAKQRNGPQGRVKLTFLKKYTRFETYADEP